MRRTALALVALFIAGGAFAQDEADRTEHPMFRWPLMGRTQKAKEGGLNIVAREGEAVHAAADGAVIFASDQLASFGKMVVIRHADDYVTTYAHLAEIAVAQGANVKRGEIIGKSGQTGDAKQPELHFELRKGKTNIDPIGYLTPH